MQYYSIGWGNGMAPTRWQAIIWAIADPVITDAYMSFSLNVLIMNLMEFNWSQQDIKLADVRLFSWNLVSW